MSTASIVLLISPAASSCLVSVALEDIESFDLSMIYFVRGGMNINYMLILRKICDFKK